MYDIWNDYAEENRYVLNTNHIITGVEVWKNNKGYCEKRCEGNRLSSCYIYK